MRYANNDFQRPISNPPNFPKAPTIWAQHECYRMRQKLSDGTLFLNSKNPGCCNEECRNHNPEQVHHRKVKVSGRRDLHPLPTAWEAVALLGELLPHIFTFFRFKIFFPAFSKLCHRPTFSKGFVVTDPILKLLGVLIFDKWDRPL